MKIRFKDLAVTDDCLKNELLESIEKVLDEGQFILGDEVKSLEVKLADYCQRKHCVGVGSGTDAVYLALRALDITHGDEVITTPLTWVATTNAIVLTGATPVFADIRDDFNIDPIKIESLITNNTKAILPVNFTGQMCDMDALKDIASKHNLYLIEDAAQSFGSKYKNNPSGSFGDISCFSINPMKNLSAYGEAGAVLTNSSEISDKLKSLRYAGTINKEDCHYPSINGRIDTLQAALILVNLSHFEKKQEKIKAIVNLYNNELINVKNLSCPTENINTVHSYYNYTILVKNRGELAEFLLSNGIETKVQHPILMPYHTAYKSTYKANIPNAEEIVSKILCLPCHDKLNQKDIIYISNMIKQFMVKYE